VSKKRLWKNKPALWLLSVVQGVRTQCMAHRSEIDRGHVLGCLRRGGRGTHQNRSDNGSNVRYLIQLTVGGARI